MPEAASGGTSQAIVWRSTALRLALAVVPAWFTIAVLVFRTSWFEKLIVGMVFGVTLGSPANGLLLAAAIAPLGQLLAMLAAVGSFRASEAAIVAFIAAWLLRALEDRPGPRVVAAIGWPLAASVVASITAQAWQLRQYPGELWNTVNRIVHAYYLIAEGIGVVDGARLLEGLALTVAVVSLFRQRPALSVRLPGVLAGSAVVAAASSVLLWRGIAPAVALARYQRIGYRVSAHIGDVNAAGSYFALIVCLAVGMAWRARQGRLARGFWLAAAIMSAVGLWLSRSRAALGTIAIVAALAIAWLIVAKWKPAQRVAVMAALVVIVIGAGAVRARIVERDSTSSSAGMREQFNATSVRMFSARPLFGVGIGRYYPTSALFLSPQLAYAYGFENAHNYYLQIAAELGALGLALFIAWLAVALIRAARALARSPRDTRLLGATAGVVAFAGTSLTGHPFLIDDVAFPFWMQFGLMAALAGSTLLDEAPTEEAAKAARPAPRALSLTGATLGVCVGIAALVSARRGPVEPPASPVVDGFYGWETDERGERFRWTSQYGSLFVPSSTTRVYIPVRMPAHVPALEPMGVTVVASGVQGGRMFVGDSWVIFNVVLPDAAPPVRFKRIDLRVDRTWQPAVYLPGNPDMRSVAVQVGECRLFSEY